MAGLFPQAPEVAAPQPGIARYGLFNAATVTDDLDARGIASGFQLPAEDCGLVRAYDANCATHPVKEFDEGVAYEQGTPYWVYATSKCGTVGTTAAEAASRVRRRLASGEQRAVEAQFWGGTAVASEPNLTGAPGVTTVTPGAPGAGAAIAALEDAFYDDYGYQGTIHISMRAYGALDYAGMLNGTGTYRTKMGSLWAIGAGYGITGPAGAAPDAGSVWAFMTPPVLIRRSAVIQPDVTQTMDRLHNQWLALAERVYTHAWVCPVVYAVQVPLAAPGVVVLT